MAKVSELYIGSPFTVQGYFLVIQPGADELAAKFLELTSVEVFARHTNPNSDFVRRIIIPANRDIGIKITPFIARDNARRVATSINHYAEKIRANKPLA